MRHLMSPLDFSVEELDKLMDLAGDIEAHPEKYAHACAGKKLATLFYEPSTRTRLSHKDKTIRSGTMQSLEEMRKELDVIDDQITTLYERRMKVCEGVAEYKIKNGRKVFDKTRENEKLAAVAEKVSTDFNKKGIRELFEQLMSMSRKLQYQRLSEEGVLGRLPFIGLDQLDLDGATIHSHAVFQSKY